MARVRVAMQPDLMASIEDLASERGMALNLFGQEKKRCAHACALERVEYRRMASSSGPSSKVRTAIALPAWRRSSAGNRRHRRDRPGAT